MKKLKGYRTIGLMGLAIGIAVFADPQVMAVIPLEWVPKIMAFWAFVGIILRYNTDTPVGGAKP